jgi:AcrR family transcriptional regulator
MEQALTRSDWVTAALMALTEGGIESVKVDRLAKHLRVSRGSFYWHFNSRADLLEALLDFWQDEFTAALIALAKGISSPKVRLRRVAAESLNTESHGVNVAKAEEALRNWAAQDATARARMLAIDDARISYIADELSKAGIPKKRVQPSAKLIYLALIGLYTARNYNPKLSDDAAYLLLIDLVLDAG